MRGGKEGCSEGTPGGTKGIVVLSNDTTWSPPKEQRKRKRKMRMTTTTRGLRCRPWNQETSPSDRTEPEPHKSPAKRSKATPSGGGGARWPPRPGDSDDGEEVMMMEAMMNTTTMTTNERRSSPVQSEWGFAGVLAPKPGNDPPYRLCIDLRTAERDLS